MVRMNTGIKLRDSKTIVFKGSIILYKGSGEDGLYGRLLEVFTIKKDNRLHPIGFFSLH